MDFTNEIVYIKNYDDKEIAYIMSYLKYNTKNTYNIDFKFSKLNRFIALSKNTVNSDLIR